MPRKSSQVKRNNDAKQLLKDLGEESSSSQSQVSFRSASTDEAVTNYGLDFSSRSTRNSPQKGRDKPENKNSSKSRAGTSRSSDGARPQSKKKTQNQSTDKDKSTSSEHQSRLNESRTRSEVSGRRRSPPIRIDQQAQTSRKSRASPRRKQRNPKRRRANMARAIDELQRKTENIMPRLPFSRLIREILGNCTSDNTYRITSLALEALQESAELYLTQIFEDSYRCTIHRDRVTLMVKDMELVRFLRGRSDPGNY